MVGPLGGSSVREVSTMKPGVRRVLTVLLASHNGSDTIGRTLSAFTFVTPPAGGWQLLVVDNASTDGTASVVASYAGRLPLRLLHEPRLGKGLALNTGLDRVDDDLVVLVDDDILPQPDFLIEWRRVADTYQDCDFFGGGIEPLFEHPPPAWARQQRWAGMLYAATSAGIPEGPIRYDSSLPFPPDVLGPNMAIRATIVSAGHRFDPRFMTGFASIMGSESEFILRLTRAGYRAGFAPGTAVHHIVNRRQVTRRWILHRCQRYGRWGYWVAQTSHPQPCPTLFGVPRYAARRAITRAFGVLPHVLRLDDAGMMAQLRLVAEDIGLMRQARLMQLAAAPIGTHKRES